MLLHTPRNAPQQKAREHVVPREAERLFDGDGNRVDQESEHVEAQEQDRNIHWQECADQVGKWVVVVRGQGEGGAERVVVFLVHAREGCQHGGFAVEDVAVVCVC